MKHGDETGANAVGVGKWASTLPPTIRTIWAVVFAIAVAIVANYIYDYWREPGTQSSNSTIYLFNIVMYALAVTAVSSLSTNETVSTNEKPFKSPFLNSIAAALFLGVALSMIAWVPIARWVPNTSVPKLSESLEFIPAFDYRELVFAATAFIFCLWFVRKQTSPVAILSFVAALALTSAIIFCFVVQPTKPTPTNNGRADFWITLSSYLALYQVFSIVGLVMLFLDIDRFGKKLIDAR